jgi:hypothetical protein
MEDGMAEKLVYVCDVCGASPAETVTFRIGGSTFQKDYCSQHLSELREGGRKPRRGRRPGTGGKSAAKRKKSSARKKSTGRKSTRRKSSGRRRKATGTRAAPEAAAQ